MPTVKKAELIEGIVHTGSPVHRKHALAHADVLSWLRVFASRDPDLNVADNLSVRLDLRNEFQPDICLWRGGGQASVANDGFLQGAPDLIAEVAVTPAAYDLHTKKTVYERAGVREYLVWVVREQKICWWYLNDNDTFAEIKETPADGLLHSTLFDGLALDCEALLGGDFAKVLQAVSPR